MSIKLISRVRAALRTSAAQPVVTTDHLNEPLHQFYKLLTLYYLSNGLYEQIQNEAVMRNPRMATLRPLRNPTFRAVEFYAAKLWPGPLPRALPIDAARKQIQKPIEQVWTWSNWAARKQRAARWLSLYGDLFIKIAELEVTDPAIGEPPWRIFFQLIKPWHVTRCVFNERGHVIEARIDVPRFVWNSRNERELWQWTEIWTRTTYKQWDRHLTQATPAVETEKQLGAPKVSRPNDLGFVPIVHAPFRDIGDMNDEGDDGERGMGVVTPALEKIDEANRMATAMHSRLYRHGGAVWALESNMMDASGRPIPAPRLQGTALAGLFGEETDTDPFLVDLGAEQVLRLPGMSKLASLVPQLDYPAMLSILQAQLLEIERDIPELRYYRMDELGEISGVAVRLMLSDAIDHVVEARGNAETALVRADQIALTMGQMRGLTGFEESAIGTYANGDFDHTFSEREVLPKTSTERAEEVAAWTQAGLPLGAALRETGMAPDKVEEILAEKDQEVQVNMERQQQLLAAKGAPAEGDRGAQPGQQGGNVARGESSPA